MSIIVSWKLIGLAIVYHINYLNCNGFTAAAINLSDESESAMIDESFEQPRIWSTLLEDLTIKWDIDDFELNISLVLFLY